MAVHRNFDDGDIFVASWTDAIQEFIGTGIANFRLQLFDATTIQVVAGTNSSQVSVGIDGLFRYISATATQAHPTGAAGVYDILVVATANSFSGRDTDATDYSFGLRMVATGRTPTGNHGGRTITNYRKLGELDWDGSRITAIRQTVGATDTTLPMSPTALLADTFPLIVRDQRGTRRWAVDYIGGFSWYGPTETNLLNMAISTRLLQIDGDLTLTDEAYIMTAGDFQLISGGLFSLHGALRHRYDGPDPITPAQIRAVSDNDARLTDARTPTDNSVSVAKTGRGDSGLARGAFGAHYREVNFVIFNTLTLTVIRPPNETCDVSGAFDVATGVYTCPETGVYLFYGTGIISGSGGSTQIIFSIYKNGVSVIESADGFSVSTGVGERMSLLPLPILCRSGDRISLCLNNTGSNNAITVTSTISFSGQLLGKT